MGTIPKRNVLSELIIQFVHFNQFCVVITLQWRIIGIEID
jgi:hypothetical protein